MRHKWKAAQRKKIKFFRIFYGNGMETPSQPRGGRDEQKIANPELRANLMSRNKAIFAGKRAKFRKQICQEEKNYAWKMKKCENISFPRSGRDGLIRFGLFGSWLMAHGSYVDQKRATCILQISMHKTRPRRKWPTGGGPGESWLRRSWRGRGRMELDSSVRAHKAIFMFLYRSRGVQLGMFESLGAWEEGLLVRFWF